MNIKKLKAKCVEKGYTAGQLAKKIKIGRTAMSYKINQHKPHDTYFGNKIIWEWNEKWGEEKETNFH